MSRANESAARPAIEVSALKVRYPTGTLALDAVSLALPGGNICAVLGPNGCGKSTLCKTLMGFQKPTSGRIEVLGGSMRDAQRANAIAYVPQSEEVDWDFPVSVWDVVMMGRQGRMNWLRIPSREDKRRVRESLERVGMERFAEGQIGELSGGQKKRVFLARALAQQARVMLLDEPFTGVDVTTERVILEIFRELRDAGMTILVVTHNLSAVPDYSDYVLMLDRSVVAFGPTPETFTSEHLATTFGGVIKELIQVAERQQAVDRQRPQAVAQAQAR